MITVMMCTCLCVWVDVDCAGPELFSTCSSKGDGSRSVHAWCLSGVGIECVGWDDLDARVLPAVFGCRRGVVCVGSHGR